MKRSLSFVAALLMAVSLGGLAGCGGTKPTPPVLRDEHGRYVTPVHYTTVRPSQTNASMPDGWTLTSNPVVTACVDQLNVSWSVLWEDNNFMPHLLQDLTANTLADVFLIPGNNANTYSTFDTLYQSGALADLTDYYNSDAPQDVKDTYNSYGPSIWQSVTRGGRIYGLPSTNNQYQHELLYVRNDWLQACNLPAPKTIQDIENTALAFIHQNPGGNTPDAPTIGININRENCFDGYRNSYGLEPLANAMGAFPKEWMQGADGKVYYGSVQPEFKQVLALAADWVQKGIIDINCFDQNATDIWNNVYSGRAGMWFFPFSWGSGTQDQAFYTNLTSQGKTVTSDTVIAYPAPLDSDGSGVSTHSSGDRMEGILCMRNGFSNPEVVLLVYKVWSAMYGGKDTAGYAALQPMRDANTLWYYIAPLNTFDVRMNDVIPKFYDAYNSWYSSGGTDPLPYGNPLSPITLEEFNRVKGWMDGDNNATNWSEYMMRYVGAGAASVTDNVKEVDPAFFGQTATMSTDWATLQMWETNMIRDILMGTDDISSFDSFVNDWKANGGDQITAEVQAAVDAFASGS